MSDTDTNWARSPSAVWILDLTFFVLCFALACFSFVWLNIVGFSPLGRFTPPLITVASMSAYLVVVFVRRAFRRSVVVDSFYYMGFLLTLVTMIYAFATFDLSGDIDNTHISDLIAQNGIALTSTVFGLICRIGFRMHGAASAPQATFLLSASDAASYIRLLESLRSLGSFAQDLASFQTVEQSSRNALATLKSNVTDVATEASSLGAELTKLTANLEGLSASHATLAKRHSDQIALYEKDFERTSLELARAVRRLSDHVASLEAKKNETVEAQTMLLQLYSELNRQLAQHLQQPAAQ